MTDKTNKPTATLVTDEDVDNAINQLSAELRANPNPEDIAKLREEYGVTFDITGTLVQIKQPRRFRKAIKAQLEEQAERSEAKGESMAKTITAGASKTGEVLLYGLVDAPVEGAKTAKQVVKTVARNTADRFKEGHQERVAKADVRKARANERRKARQEAKAAQEEAEAKAEKLEARAEKKKARTEKQKAKKA